MNKIEKIENALMRIEELLELIKCWAKPTKEEDLLNQEFKKKKQKMIENLEIKLASLNDRFLFTNESEFKTKEYIVEYENIKKQIHELEK